jgi:ribose 1,5-bisphosphokinase
MSRALPDRTEQELIGPGRVVLVVGPSGAGKDTLIAIASGQVPEAVVQSRVVTRPPSETESNEELSETAFAAALAAGDFAVHWEAHGHKYGLRRDLDDHVRSGRTVVVNVSRSIVRLLRGRYASIVAVLVTAPPDVLMARLAGRDRVSDGPLDRRLARASLDVDPGADIIINNVGEPWAMAQPLVEAMRGHS